MLKTKLIPFILTFILIFTFSFSSIYAKPNKATLSPTNLHLVIANETDVTISWNLVSGAYKYEVFRSTYPVNNYIKAGAVTSTSFTETHLSPSTTYSYYVKAVSKFSTSPASEVLLVTTKATEPQQPPLPEEPPISNTKTVLGYATYYYNGDSSSYNSMVTNKDAIDKIATHTYITDPLGNINGLIPVDQINYANNNGIEVLAMISNNFDGSITKTLLESYTNRQNLINNINNQIKTYNYDGVNIDFEGVYYQNRSHLNLFMQELYNSLNPKGYKVTIAVPAKTYDNPLASWNGAFDYAELNKYSDAIVIMAYDEHWSGGAPGSIASIGWVTNVVNYATTVIPPEKILLGVAAYGYDWSSKGGKAYGIDAIYRLATTYNATIQWDSVSASPYFTYTDTDNVLHTVWFENEYSLPFKLNLVNDKNLQGIAIWKLGLENSAYFNKIIEKLR